MKKTRDPLRAVECLRCMTECLIDHADYGHGHQTTISTVAAYMPRSATLADLRAILGLLPGIMVDGACVHGLKMRPQAADEDSPLVRFVAASCVVGVGRRVLLSEFCQAYDSDESGTQVARQLRLLPGLTVRPGSGNRTHVYGLDLAYASAITD